MWRLGEIEHAAEFHRVVAGFLDEDVT